ncbi:MAG TPA: BlaI/MecI/CopY family transcriptional regulator [Candidatus Eremiobacteraceae bacterium]|nr:BlaI/MecI/CopY family transcriptional regulator [Candidatus Eremiobacteraceae bacterium]
MARKRSSTLTEVEQRLMEIIWERRSATVSEVLAKLSQEHRVAFNTVQTMLRILERKGYLRHKVQGRAFRYYPIVDRGQASTSAVKQLLNRFFDGAPGKLAINILENERLSEGDLAQLKRLIGDARTKR